MYILREGYNAIGTSIVTAHCILEMFSIYQFLSSWTELWGGSTCGSPAVLPWSAHYMELWASPLLSFLSFVFTAMSSRDIIALAIVDMFSKKTAILLTRSLLARIHLVPLKGPIQSRDSNIASAYCSLRLYISSPHWQQEGKTIVTQFSPSQVSWLRKKVAENAFWADGGQLVQGKNAARRLRPTSEGRVGLSQAIWSLASHCLIMYYLILQPSLWEKLYLVWQRYQSVYIVWQH